jgi:DNA-binding transcriptional regulator YdaS (Cro superfamily)
MAAASPLEPAIQTFGVKGLADALGESMQTITNWRARGVPANRCVAVEQLTGISRRVLRPLDWSEYWPDLAD